MEIKIRSIKFRSRDPMKFRDADGHPTAVNYVAPCVTSNTNVNPSMRMYDLDRETFELLDYETYYMDISELERRGSNCSYQFGLFKFGLPLLRANVVNRTGDLRLNIIKNINRTSYNELRLEHNVTIQN